MKTINEIAHKSADDVLKAWECCEHYDAKCDECPYNDDSAVKLRCADRRVNDTLYYVYQYKVLSSLMPSAISAVEMAVKKGMTIG